MMEFEAQLADMVHRPPAFVDNDAAVNVSPSYDSTCSVCTQLI